MAKRTKRLSGCYVLRQFSHLLVVDRS
jgi:hypothetical protein